MSGLPPMLRAQLEELDETLTAAGGAAVEAQRLAAIARQAADTALNQEWQARSELLSAIADIDQADTGLILIDGTDSVTVLPTSAIVLNLGKGTTANRPTDGQVGVYFDTTLAAAGKPIWYTGTAWVDATGAVV